MIAGESVVVVRPVTEVDELGEPTSGEPEKSEVRGVIVAPGKTSSLDAGRPNGVSVAYTLHFPKGYGKSLRGCGVIVRGVRYAVIGDPVPYTEANVPGAWSMPVEVARVDG